MNTLNDLIQKKAAGLSGQLLEAIGTPVLARKGTRSPYSFQDDYLVRAATTALVLGQPLILSGEPGVGKTQFAEALAAKLGLPYLDPYQVKSTDTGMDLIYRFDQVSRFQDEKNQRGLASHVQFTQLGLAMLWSAGPDHQVRLSDISVADLLGSNADRSGSLTLKKLFPSAFSNDRVTITEPTRGLVLLDELDKAPRDAPNDILGEIEKMRFAIPELGIAVEADPAYWPVVLITSNSERTLPDAFLRRCTFHWIDFPDDDSLRQIVVSHVASLHDVNIQPDCELLTSATACFNAIRKSSDNKKPATAEFIAFVLAHWEAGYRHSDTISLDDDLTAGLLGTLIKTKADRQSTPQAQSNEG